jgi:two-component system, chemotaxis family, CheB/CheR fusion protein
MTANGDSTTATTQASSSDRSTTVVGIGASAGGVEALCAFFDHLGGPKDLAIVVVQHLDPTHEGRMVEVLRRHTTWEVDEATDRAHVAAGHVFVIPPDRDLTLDGDVLRLAAPDQPRGHRMPIDGFFRSLSLERGDRAVGLVLSGMGSDGTDGLRSIHAAGGFTLVQAPESAKFDAMPRGAIDAGVVDVIAPVEALPDCLRAGRDHLSHAAVAAAPADEVAKVIDLLETRTGRDLSLYKRTTVARRIDRRLLLHQLASVSDYLQFVARSPEELDILYDDLLIGVTSFFRDPEVWTSLRDHVLPDLIAGAVSTGGVFRVWTPGCSTGEEAYTVAITFRESLDRMSPRPRLRLQVFATDVDPVAIERARCGEFTSAIEADVSPERLSRFFRDTGGGYRIAPEIREMVVFAQQDVISDPPFTRIDVITCRNLMIYFNPELQRRLLALFHYALRPHGILVLGSAESTTASPELFESVVERARILRRRDVPTPPRVLDYPLISTGARSFAPVERPAHAAAVGTLQSIVDDILRRKFAPAAVLATAGGEVVFVNGRTGKYLEPPVGKATLNLMSMARDSLKTSVAHVFRMAEQQRSVCAVQAVNADAKPPSLVEITAMPVTEPPAAASMILVVFNDLGPADLGTDLIEADGAQPASTHPAGAQPAGDRAFALAAELTAAHAELRATREEMQTTKEELTSMNEELQSANEELQSANEELMTSKEEMQSMNEELHTINVELQARVEELMMQSDDMKNLLDSTNIATLFLDNGLCVRRFTPKVTAVFKLIPSDIGRAITDLSSRLSYPELAVDVATVLEALRPIEREVPADDDRWFSVRVMPYRTQDNRIDGAVLTFTDITAAKQLETELRAATSGLEQRLAGRGSKEGTT